MNEALHIIVLAAGEGKRMQSARAKVLQPLGGEPMLQHVLAAAAGLEPAAMHVVIGFDANSVHDVVYTFDENQPNIDVNHVIQQERLGTGHAVQQAMQRVPDTARVLVLPGDMPLVRTGTLQQLDAVFRTSGAALVLTSFVAADPQGYGRILRAADGQVLAIREQTDVGAEEALIDEVNSGILMADAARLNGWLGRLNNDNQQQEYYLTDCIGLAVADGELVQAEICPDTDELKGANDSFQLAELEAVLQQQRTCDLMRQGVRMPMPHSVQIRGLVRVGRDVMIDAGVILEGAVELGDDVIVGTGSVVRNSRLASGTRIEPYSVLDNAETTGPCAIGPFARLRPGTIIAEGCKIGNFVETKNAQFEPSAKASHLSYIGDTHVGRRANLGAGTITCNYDGVNKHRTEIGEQAFIGSNSALVAPVKIGSRATIGAGSVITRDVPEASLTLSRARQKSLANWNNQKKTSKK
ncbi:MAG: bifunctional UDP-N-acetylglucosamine diphosphorylase/glucosamine-1-phosphate N-acetyltransferase GlmU [Pseudomonadota bacterium]